MTRFEHVLGDLRHEHDRLLHVNDDEFDNQLRIQDFGEDFLLSIQSKSQISIRINPSLHLPSSMLLQQHVDLLLEFHVQDHHPLSSLQRDIIL